MRPQMTTGQLATRLGVSPETVRNYTADFSEFLSSEAVGVALNAKRRYTDHDALIIATAVHYRSLGQGVDEVSAAIREGKLLDKLPEAPTPEETAARESVKLVPMPAYERALSELQMARDLLVAKHQELERVIAERDSALLSATEAARRIGELQHEIGVLEGQLSERRLTMQVVVLAAIGVVVIILALVILLAGRGG